MSESLIETVTSPPGTVITATQRRRWTWAYGLYTGVTSFSFTNAVWVIFLATHGYSPLAIGLMETLFHVAKFVAEVPTGAFADLVGRRASLITACILNVLDLLLFLHPTPPFMILSFILAGTGFAFRGGAGDAILWSIAVGEDLTTRTASFSRLFSLMFVVSLGAELVGSASGGFMGHALAFAPFAAQIVAYSLGALCLLQLPEQRGGSDEERVSPLRHIVAGLRATWHEPLLLGLLILSALVDCSWTTTNYYTQLYVHVLGYSLSVVGVLVALTLATSVIFTTLTPRLMRHLTGRWLVPSSFAALITGLLLMSAPWPAASLVGYLLLFPAGVSALTPALSTYINARSPDAQRATVLSFQTGMFSMAMIVLFPLFGLGVVHLPFSMVYRLTALALGAAAALVGAMLWRRAGASPAGLGQTPR